MPRNLMTDYTASVWTVAGFVVVLLNSAAVRCSAANPEIDGPRSNSSRQILTSIKDFPWLELTDGALEYGAVLSRERRATNDTSKSKTVWEKIEEFYSDKNNMAMYCVLPIMILIYGGCSAIYCIYKCRQYLRRRKHKRLKEEDCESLNSEKTDLSQGSKDFSDKDRPVSQISQAWTDLQVDPSEKRWSGQTKGTSFQNSSPLPWQIPNKATSAAALANVGHQDNRPGSRASYLEDKLRDNNIFMDNRKDGQKHAANNPDPNHLPRQPPVQVKAVDPQALNKSRALVNMADYATNRSSTAKAADFSRFSDSRPIEIIPLSADPNLRAWDPLHNRPFGDKLSPGYSQKPGAHPQSVQAMKEELMARYDAMATLQMAKKAAEILSTNAVEKNPFQRKPNKKKKLFVAE